MSEEVNAFLEKAPKLRKRDIEEINGFFRSFIFRRKTTGEVWTTCCRKWARLPEDHPIWWEEHEREPKNAWDGKQAARLDQTPCPFCGKKGTVKDLRYSGRRQNLTQYRRVCLLRWDGKALWAICGEFKKSFENERDFTAAPMGAPGSLYRFGKTELTVADYGYWGYHDHLSRYVYAGFGKKTADEPFGWCVEEGNSYRVAGLDAIEKSPAKYCLAEDYLRQSGQIVKFLHVAHVYPRQVEMLMKTGLSRVVYDLAKKGVKHAAVLDWTQTDPKRAWKVPPEIVREFLRTETVNGEREIGVLELWKTVNRREKASFAEVSEAWDFLGYHREAMRVAKGYGIGPMRLWRYLDRQNHCQVHTMYQAWKDYIAMAEERGLPIYRSDVLLPADLNEKHEEAVAERNRRIREEHLRVEREARAAEEKEDAEYREKLLPTLEKRYAWADGGYLIAIPRGKDEILREGRALQHCVGGYAHRHITGAVTILFMRRETEPDKPWITIEMRGAKLVQIHGFKNEGLYTADGRFAPDPREVYRDFLDPWLEWVAKGSRRKKDGTPVVKKRIATAAEPPRNDKKGDAA